MKGDSSLTVHLHRRAVAKCRARVPGAIGILLGRGRGAIRVRPGRGPGAIGKGRACVSRSIGAPSGRGSGTADSLSRDECGAIGARRDLVPRAVGECRNVVRASGAQCADGRGTIGKRCSGGLAIAIRSDPDLVREAIGKYRHRLNGVAAVASIPPGLRRCGAIGTCFAKSACDDAEVL